jgi:retron-type reverse transcriptase
MTAVRKRESRTWRKRTNLRDFQIKKYPKTEAKTLSTSPLSVLRQLLQEGTGQESWQKKTRSLSIIRYADDFVILHEDITVVERCQQIIAEWLKDMGLELKPSKTRLTHTLNKCDKEEPGFNFLGFFIKQWKVGKYH